MPGPKRSNPQTFHDAGFGGHLNPVSPAERAAAAEEREKADKAEGEFMEKVLPSKPRKPDILDAVITVANAESVLTPHQRRLRQLGLVLHKDGELMTDAEARRLEAEEEQEYEGAPTAAERAAIERFLASDGPEEDIWHDTDEDEWTEPEYASR